MIAIRIRTSHDRNGNPRRGWIIVNDEGETVAFVDEGYAGQSALLCLFDAPNKPPVTGAIEVTPREYHAQLHAQKERDGR